jgi:hypothetical protein
MTFKPSIQSFTERRLAATSENHRRASEKIQDIDEVGKHTS